jgi:hypothetical protein
LRRNCLLQQVIEGKIKGGIEVIWRRGRRRRKLVDDLKERRGYSHFKEEALNRTVWRARFGIGFGPVVRQTTEWMNQYWCNSSLTGKRKCWNFRQTNLKWSVDLNDYALNLRHCSVKMSFGPNFIVRILVTAF